MLSRSKIYSACLRYSVDIRVEILEAKNNETTSHLQKTRIEYVKNLANMTKTWCVYMLMQCGDDFELNPQNARIIFNQTVCLVFKTCWYCLYLSENGFNIYSHER